MPKLKRCMPYVVVRWLLTLWLIYNCYLLKPWAIALALFLIFISFEIISNDIQVLDETTIQ